MQNIEHSKITIDEYNNTLTVLENLKNSLLLVVETFCELNITDTGDEIAVIKEKVQFIESWAYSLVSLNTLTEQYIENYSNQVIK